MMKIREYQTEAARTLIDGLSSIPGVKVYGTCDADRSVAIVSIAVDSCQVSEIGLRLDEEFGILSRVGLHCAPAAHRTIGTFPQGTVRLAPGVFTTMDDITVAVRAIEEVVRS